MKEQNDVRLMTDEETSSIFEDAQQTLNSVVRLDEIESIAHDNRQSRNGFLAKISSKLKSLRNSKIVKRIASFALATSITFSLSACTNINNPSPNSSTTSTASTTSSATNQRKYSTLVQNILKNDEYSRIADLVMNKEIESKSPLLDPHPYSFLASQGHDVEGVKSGRLKCNTISFVKDTEPNNLYIATYIENAGTTPYYTEYMLQVTLTDQEMDDYDYLHDNGGFIQAVFMNDVATQYKKVNIISKTNVSVTAHEGLAESLGKLGAGGMKGLNVILKDYNLDNQTFNVYCYVRTKNNSDMTENGKLFLAPLRRGNEPIYIKDNIYLAPFSNGQFNRGSNYASTQPEDVKYYTTQGAYLVRPSMKSISNN